MEQDKTPIESEPIFTDSEVSQILDDSNKLGELIPNEIKYITVKNIDWNNGIDINGLTLPCRKVFRTGNCQVLESDLLLALINEGKDKEARLLQDIFRPLHTSDSPDDNLKNVGVFIDRNNFELIQ